MAVGLVVLAVLTPATASINLPHGSGSYVAGCNLQHPGDRVVGPFGTATSGANASIQNSTTHLWSRYGADWQWGISPMASSFVAQELYWSVGPPLGAGTPGTPAGCYDPMHNRTGQTATYEWVVTYRAYVAGNCTPGHNASASVSVQLEGDVHFMAPPFYVFKIHPALSLYTKAVRCAHHSTGTLRTGFVNMTTPAFNLTAGVNYDLYTAVSTITTTTATGTASAYAGVTIAKAQLVRVSCTC